MATPAAGSKQHSDGQKELERRAKEESSESMQTLLENERQKTSMLEKAITEKDATLKDCYEHMKGQTEYIEDMERQLKVEVEKNSTCASQLKDLEQQLRMKLEEAGDDMDGQELKNDNYERENRELRKQCNDMSKYIRRLEQERYGAVSDSLPYPVSCTSTLSSVNAPVPCSSLGLDHSPCTQEVMLRDTKMALERMEKEVEEHSVSWQRSQADILAERFDEERVEHREKVRCLEEETQQWRKKYESLIAESASENEAATRKVKYLENQQQQASEKESELLSQISELQSQISELQGTLSEQNAMLQEYYGHMREQENTIESLKSEIESMRGHGGELKRANEEKKQLKMEIERNGMSLKEYADQCDTMLKDLERRDAMVKEAQRQQAECYRRLQLAEGEVAQLRMKLEAVNKRLEAVESEKAHMDVQLCVYLKDFQDEQKAKRELEQRMNNAVMENKDLKERCNDLTKQLEEPHLMPRPTMSYTSAFSVNIPPPVPCSSMGTPHYPLTPNSISAQKLEGSNGYPSIMYHHQPAAAEI